MSAIAFYFPIPGTPTALGYQLSFNIAGTATPTPVYHDSDLSEAWDQPIVFNAAGQPGNPIFLAPTPALKVLYLDDANVPVDGYPFDDYSPAAVAT